jgi:hypothetical protein
VVSKYLLNNQPDALIIQIYSVIEQHVSGILFAHHQFSTVHSALANFVRVLMTASKQRQDRTALQFHPDSTWKRSSKPARNLPVPNVQWKTPDDGQRGCPKHVDFYNRPNLDN